MYSKAHAFDRYLFSNTLSIAGVIILCLAISLISKQTPYPGFWGLLPSVGAACIIISGKHAWVNRVILSNKFLVAIGLISYPLYLWHWPILSFLRITESGVPDIEMRIGGISLAFFLAWVTYRWVEKPMRFGGHREIKTILLIALMIIIGFVGYYTYAREGLKFRGASNHGHMLGQLDIPVSARSSDDSCERKHLLTVSDGVTCLSNSENPGILIVGDSHAMALNFAAHFKLVNANTILVASSGCLPFLNSELVSAKTKRSCLELVRQYHQALEKIPSIKTVVFASMSPDEFFDKNGNDTKLFISTDNNKISSEKLYE